MPTSNEELLDRAIAHQVDLQRYSNNVVRRMIALLNRVDSRLAAELTDVIESARSSEFKMARLESLLGDVRRLNKKAYDEVGKALTDELRDFAEYETEWQLMTLDDVTPASVAIAGVSATQVAAAAMARPFQGVLLKGVLADVDDQTAKKIRQAVAQGIVEGRTTDQIVREIRGTRAAGYADGLLNKARRDVEAITRTAIAHTAAVARDEVMDANDDIIKGVAWLATLDQRTSSECRIRDGKLYTAKPPHKPIGHSVPWLGGPGRLHWNCRSTSTPVLKSWREIGLDIDGSPDSATTRASMDGQVPKEVTYLEWLGKQSYARQVDVLGPTRAKLLKNGGLKPEQLYNTKGEYLTLDQLREKDSKAFKRAEV